jgi:hypothetical protein
MGGCVETRWPRQQPVETHKADAGVADGTAQILPLLVNKSGRIGPQGEWRYLQARIAERTNGPARFGKGQVLKEFVTDGKTVRSGHSH